MGPHLINVRQLRKVYKTPTGDVLALKDIDVEVAPGEFVGVIGKSGSGKTTFINMLTGIDRPTSGAVLIGETLVHSLGEDDLAAWRGRNLGIVFQFFQLLPTLSLIENVMLPMDINRMYSSAQRRSRAQELLDLVGMAEYGHKLPADVSGGQQQRAAIARALANNPPLLIADEPTGNLDSKSANQIFELFRKLAAGGTTILMVTHDDDLIKRVDRTIAIHDGEVVNEYLARPHGPSVDYRAEVQGQGRRVAYAPGATVTRHGERGQEFFIVLEGKVQVLLPQPGGRELLVGELAPGQYFGEAALLGHTPYPTTVRAAQEGGTTLAVFDADTFHEAVSRSARLRADLGHLLDWNILRRRTGNREALADEAGEMTRGLESKTFAPGTVVYRQGSIGHSLYFIVDGVAEVVVQPPHGAELVLERLERGEYFGETPAGSHSRRMVTVRAGPDRPLTVSETEDDEQFKQRLMNSRTFHPPQRSDGVSG